MRTQLPRLALGFGLALSAALALAAGVENKWRLQFSGDAESDGRIVLQLAPSEGAPMSASVDVRNARAVAPEAQRFSVASIAVSSGPRVLISCAFVEAILECVQPRSMGHRAGTRTNKSQFIVRRCWGARRDAGSSLADGGNRSHGAATCQNVAGTFRWWNGIIRVPETSISGVYGKG